MVNGGCDNVGTTCTGNGGGGCATTGWYITVKAACGVYCAGGTRTVANFLGWTNNANNYGWGCTTNYLWSNPTFQITAPYDGTSFLSVMSSPYGSGTIGLIEANQTVAMPVKYPQALIDAGLVYYNLTWVMSAQGFSGVYLYITFYTNSNRLQGTNLGGNLTSNGYNYYSYYPYFNIPYTSPITWYPYTYAGTIMSSTVSTQIVIGSFNLNINYFTFAVVDAIKYYIFTSACLGYPSLPSGSNYTALCNGSYTLKGLTCQLACFSGYTQVGNLTAVCNPAWSTLSCVDNSWLPVTGTCTPPTNSASHQSKSHRSASHRSASHRSASHRSKSHRSDSKSHKSKSHRSDSKSHKSKSHRSFSHRSKSHKSKSHRSDSKSHKSKSHRSDSKSHKSLSHRSASHKSKSHKSASHRSASHRSASHKSASHRSASHKSKSHKSASHASLSHRSVSRRSKSHSKSHQSHSKSQTFSSSYPHYISNHTNNSFCTSYTSELFLGGTTTFSCGSNRCICSVQLAYFGLVTQGTCNSSLIKANATCSTNLTNLVYDRCYNQHQCSFQWGVDFGPPANCSLSTHQPATFVALGQCCTCVRSQSRSMSTSASHSKSMSDSASASQSLSDSRTTSLSSSQSRSDSNSQSVSLSHSKSASKSDSRSMSGSASASRSQSTSHSDSHSASRSLSTSTSQSNSGSISYSRSASMSISQSKSGSSSQSRSASTSSTHSQSDSDSYSKSVSLSLSKSLSITKTVSLSDSSSASQSASSSLSKSGTRSQSDSSSNSQSVSLSASKSASVSSTRSQSGSLSRSQSDSLSNSQSDSMSTSQSRSDSSSKSQSASLSSSQSASMSTTQSRSDSSSRSLSESSSDSQSKSMSSTRSRSESSSNSRSKSSSETTSQSDSSSNSQSKSLSVSQSASKSATQSESISESQSLKQSVTRSRSQSESFSGSQSVSSSASLSLSSKQSLSQSKSDSFRESQSASVSDTVSLSLSTSYTQSDSSSDSYSKSLSALESQSATHSISESQSISPSVSNSESASLSFASCPTPLQANPNFPIGNGTFCFAVTTFVMPDLSFSLSCSFGFQFCSLNYSAIGLSIIDQPACASANQTSHGQLDCYKNLTTYVNSVCLNQQQCDLDTKNMILHEGGSFSCGLYTDPEITFLLTGSCCNPNPIVHEHRVNVRNDVYAFNRQSYVNEVNDVPICPVQIEVSTRMKNISDPMQQFDAFSGVIISPQVASVNAQNPLEATIVNVTCQMVLYLSPDHRQLASNFSFVSNAIQPTVLFVNGCDQYQRASSVSPNNYVSYNTVPHSRDFDVLCRQTYVSNLPLVPYWQYDLVFNNLARPSTLTQSVTNTSALAIVMMGLLPGDFFYIDQITIGYSDGSIVYIPSVSCNNYTLRTFRCSCTNYYGCDGFNYITSPIMFDDATIRSPDDA